MDFTQIIDFKLGASIRGFFICKDKHIKLTKNGDLYLDIILIDATGSIHCKMWDLVSDFQHRFSAGSAVAVKGSVGEFNNTLQLIITQINTASKLQYSKYGFNEKSLIRYVKEPIDSLWSRIEKNSKSLKKPLYNLVSSIFKKHKDKIQTIPYSSHDQFPLKGGFLKSIAINLEICSDLIKYYPLLDEEIAIAGTILFRIGMIEAFNNELLPNFNEKGILIGPSVLGRDLLLLESKKIKINTDDIRKIEHIILCSEPSVADLSDIPEALFVCGIYNLNDSMVKINDL